MKTKAIYELFETFHLNHPKYFGDKQVAQLEILKKSVDEEKTLSHSKSEKVHEEMQANRDIFLDVCKQLLGFIDGKANARKVQSKTQTGNFFKTKVAQAKQVLNIDQDDEILRTQIMKIFLKSDQDLYFEMQVFRWMEAYNRSNPKKTLITEKQKNYIKDILKQHLPIKKLFDEISTIISASPNLQAKINAEYQTVSQSIEQKNVRLQPKEESSKTLKSKKAKKPVVIEASSRIEDLKQQLALLESDLAKIKVDINVVKLALEVSKNEPKEDKQKFREVFLYGMNEKQKREIRFYFDVVDQLAEEQKKAAPEEPGPATTMGKK